MTEAITLAHLSSCWRSVSCFIKDHVNSTRVRKVPEDMQQPYWYQFGVEKGGGVASDVWSLFWVLKGKIYAVIRTAYINLWAAGRISLMNWMRRQISATPPHLFFLVHILKRRTLYFALIMRPGFSPVNSENKLLYARLAEILERSPVTLYIDI